MYMQLNIFFTNSAMDRFVLKLYTCTCTYMYIYIHQFYSNQVSPRNGAWDMRRHEFLSGVEIDEWAVAVCNFNKYPPSRDDIGSA